METQDDVLKFNNIKNEVLSTIKPDYDKAILLSKSINNRMNNLFSLINERIKEKCKEEYRWLEAKSIEYNINGKIKYELDDDDIIDENFKKYEECSKKNDFGGSLLLVKLNSIVYEVNSKGINLINQCQKNMNLVSSNDTTKCVKDGYSYLINESIQKINEIEKDLIQIEKKINI